MSCQAAQALLCRVAVKLQSRCVTLRGTWHRSTGDLQIKSATEQVEHYRVRWRNSWSSGIFVQSSIKWRNTWISGILIQSPIKWRNSWSSGIFVQSSIKWRNTWISGIFVQSSIKWRNTWISGIFLQSSVKWREIKVVQRILRTLWIVVCSLFTKLYQFKLWTISHCRCHSYALQCNNDTRNPFSHKLTSV